jgi:hypothetical protein
MMLLPIIAALGATAAIAAPAQPTKSPHTVKVQPAAKPTAKAAHVKPAGT